MVFLRLGSTLVREAWRAAWRAGWLLYAGIAVGATVVFGGYGMHPRDLTRAMTASPGLGAALWLTWLLVALPLARAVLVVPSTFWLRSLPVPRRWLVLLHGFLLLDIEGAWVLLWGLGGGLVGGARAALCVVGLHALLLARPWRLGDVLLLLGLVGAVVAPPQLGVLLAGLAAPVALWRAVARAPESAVRRGVSLVRGPAPLALAMAHLTTLLRGDATRLGRGLLLALLGSAIGDLGARNNGLSPASAKVLLLATGSATLPLAVVGVLVALLRAELVDRWLLDVTSTSGVVRVLAVALVGGTWGAFLGALQATVIGADGRLLQMLLGGLVGVFLSAALRSTVRGLPKDGARSFVLVVGLALGLCIAAVYVQRAMVLGLAPAALVACWVAAARASETRRQLRVVEDAR